MKVISIKKEQILFVLYIAIITLGIFGITKREAVTTFSTPVSKKVILIDAGHGGWDPGKVGVDDTLEKEINLSIAEKLQAYLEQGGCTVITTRTGDDALGDKKTSDMNNRIAIANEGKADMVISIHQNSYPVEEVKGTQVFYYDGSEESKKLAECVQNEIVNFTGQERNRGAKANENYYMLKQTEVPTVIVECGFLSNPEELNLLASEEYQEKLAWGIYQGILDYYENE